MKSLPSPNFNERDAAIKVQFIVLHYTGMKTAQDALARLCDATAQVSAHYVIDEDGTLYALVDESKRAWHAGKSFWRGITDINSASVGIELVNPGHEFGYRPFPITQIAALKTLVRDIAERWKMVPSDCLLAHSDIAPMRKEDPGELFPWRELAQDGFGLWPEYVSPPPVFTRGARGGQPQAPALVSPTPSPSREREGSTIGLVSENDSQIREMLGSIGYDCPLNGDYSPVLRAFQRRYYPENVTGVVDGETVARLRRLSSLVASIAGASDPFATLPQSG